MASLQTQTARLLFCCTYQQTAPVGMCEQNHLKLAQDCIDYLHSLNNLQSGAYYEWECYPHAVQAQSELVEVSVYFVPKHNRYSSTISVLQARQLWNVLLERYGCEESWTLFDGRMHWINMLPVDVDSPGAQATLTFGQLIEGIPATIDPRIDGEEVAKLSTGSSMALALDTFLLMLESCCKIIARCPSAVLQDVAFESTPADMSKLVSSLSLTDALPMHLSRSDMNPHDASISDSSMSLYAVAEFVREPKDPTSSATESQPERKAKWQEIALDMAKAISNVRMQIQTPAYGGTTEQELVEAVEYADGFRIGFQDSHRAAMARIRHCLVMDVPSAALYYEAMQSVKRLQNLSRCLTVGSKTLITILENRRKSRNVKLGTVMGTAALTTAAVLTTAATTMLPALVVVSAAYAGVGVTAATAPYLTLKWFEESPQGEKLKQAQQHIDKVHQTLFEQIVACFVTRAWGMNLQTLSPADREKTLKGFGLEQNYFDTYEYNEAKLRGALEEVENAHDSLMYDLEGVFMDIGTTVNKTETATTRPARQLSSATVVGQISSGRAC